MIIIPTCLPSKDLLDLVDSLIGSKQILVKDLLIINDHSDINLSENIFKILNEKNIKIINNDGSKGKGAAIKLGVNYANSNGANYVLIADSDGQHHFSDILNILNLGKKNSKFIIGSRNFSSNVPLRNRYGNKLSSLLYFIMTKFKIRDCQCGLRYVPKKYFQILINTKVNNFDFEMYTLFKIMQTDHILQENIKTIYSKENYTTNFRILIDSFKIILVFIKIFFKIRKESKKINT